MKNTIEGVKGYERIDSRGNPTVMAVVQVADIIEQALVPSGASTGTFEAMELRDGQDVYYGGKGVQEAVNNIAKIADVIADIDITDQVRIDQAMIDLDGTENKGRIGANAILAVSLAVSRAAAKYKGVPLYQHIAETFGNDSTIILPTPMMNVLNGGVHSGWQSSDFQEFMIVPQGASSFTEAVRWGSEIYHTLKTILKDKGLPTLVGDEGGFAPRLKTNENMLQLIIEAIEQSNYVPGEEVAIALDPATSELFDSATGLYKLHTEDRELSSHEMVSLWESWVDKYPIVSIEDGLGQEDWKGWQFLTERLGARARIVADDLLVTNPARVRRAIKEKSANALLVKPNQIGTLTETAEAVRLCQDANWELVVSHRSGETEDPIIADIGVGLGMRQIKTGAPARSDRTGKYNRLLDIEQRLTQNPGYAGSDPFLS